MAVGKPSEQTSTWPKDKNIQLAGFANDGDYTTRSVTNWEKKPHWEVNLMKPTYVRLIRLHLWKYAFKSNYYRQLAIHTRLTGTYVWSLCKMIGSPKSMMVEIKCDAKTFAQYVQVRLAGPRVVLYLTEVEIFE